MLRIRIRDIVFPLSCRHEVKHLGKEMNHESCAGSGAIEYYGDSCRTQPDSEIQSQVTSPLAKVRRGAYVNQAWWWIHHNSIFTGAGTGRPWL